MRKKGYAFGLCVLSIVTIALIAAGVGTTEWTVGKIGKNDTDGCIVTRKIGLFKYEECRVGCKLENACQPTADVYDSNVFEFNEGLQYTVIAFCGVSIICSLIVMAISAINICTNPYETYLSAFGMMIYNIVGLIASLVAVILYVVLLYTELKEPLLYNKPEAGPATSVYGENGYSMEEDAYFGYSFFLVVVSIVTYGIGIALSILSERDTVKKIKKIIAKKEKENPAEEMNDVMSY